jgi:hypothetical protein
MSAGWPQSGGGSYTLVSGSALQQEVPGICPTSATDEASSEDVLLAFIDIQPILNSIRHSSWRRYFNRFYYGTIV